jgi:hypothetical protein
MLRTITNPGRNPELNAFVVTAVKNLLLQRCGELSEMGLVELFSFPL